MVSVLAGTSRVSPIKYKYFCQVPKASLKYGDYKPSEILYGDN